MLPPTPIEPAPDATELPAHREAPAKAGVDIDAIIKKVSEVWANQRVQLGVRIAGVSIGVMFVVAALAWTLLFAGMGKLPSEAELWTLNRQPAVQFVDASGRTLAVRGHLYGPAVRSSELPIYIGQAFIAAEDQRFMSHGGVDPQAILRAAFANAWARRTVQGGSTLTQQLVKNLLVGDEQTLRRKVQEARLAAEMEKELSKQEILDLYLNRVYLGSNAYGVEAAAEAYFGKPAAKLSLAEAAFLAALPKAPSRYAGEKTGAQTIARVHYVLDRMVGSGFVTPAAAASARAQTLKFVNDGAEAPVSGYVLDQAMAEVKALGLTLPADAVITLTVDRKLQRQAETALNAALSVRGLGASQGAVVVLDRSGEIRALVGGRDYATSQFNRATQAQRQPGSTFKTFVYAAALEHGLTPATIRNDAPVDMPNWQPSNYEDNYRGPITLAKALAISSNSVAVQVGTEVGPRQVAELAKRFGITSPMHAYPSIALGADEVNLLEMTSAYGVLANEGRRPQTAHIVSEIHNQRGEVLYAAPKGADVQVYAADAARTLTGMLSNVVRFGTGVRAQVPGWQVAGKTGTSQSWRDAWFVGYSARMVAGVWIGNDDDRATAKVTGGGAAAALFAKVMIAAHRGLKPEPLAGVELGAQWLDSTFSDETVDPAIADVAVEALPEDVAEKPDVPLKVEAAEPIAVVPHAPVQPAAERPALLNRLEAIPAVEQPRVPPQTLPAVAPLSIAPPSPAQPSAAQPSPALSAAPDPPAKEESAPDARPPSG
jgi:penicillin-binding protein 1A